MTYGDMGIKTSTISSWKIANGIRPITIIKVVTMLLTAMEIVETISCSSLPDLVFAIFCELIEQGNFKLAILPVIKDRYCPPVPRSGAYDMASIKPIAQYPAMNGIDSASTVQFGVTPSATQYKTGTRQIKPSANQVNILPKLCICVRCPSRVVAVLNNDFNPGNPFIGTVSTAVTSEGTF